MIEWILHEKYGYRARETARMERVQRRAQPNQQKSLGPRTQRSSRNGNDSKGAHYNGRDEGEYLPPATRRLPTGPCYGRTQDHHQLAIERRDTQHPLPSVPSTILD